jgi:glycosyltransferase involved in cell wall biosynthesis
MTEVSHATLWFDVEDLFHHARTGVRPSGIQRAGFEIYRALQQRDGAPLRVRFLRHIENGTGFAPVSWDALDALFASISHAAVAAPAVVSKAEATCPSPPPHGEARGGRQVLRRVAEWLPSRLRRPLVLAVVLQLQCGVALLRLVTGLVVTLGWSLRHVVRSAVARLRPRGTRAPQPADGPFVRLARPGDTLVVLGSPWFHEDYGAVVRRLRDQLGLRVAILVHDVIPLRRPEWCDYGTVRTFRAWHAAVLPLCDVVFTNSQATAADLRELAPAIGVSLPVAPHPVPFGTGFGAPVATPDRAADEDLPVPGSYVLVVATIEARKNHALMVRVWRRLLETMPPHQVPTLVFAGGVGWLVADLMQQLENSDWLGGRIRLIRHPSDAALRTLYRGCLFTVFPSFYEGWGLPVSESLAFGKPCLAARTTSLPEVGGSLARYFDPAELDDATDAIGDMIRDPAELAEWEAQVIREFRPVAWTVTADAILQALAPKSDGPPGAADAPRDLVRSLDR